jgi:hypothetical protein
MARPISLNDEVPVTHKIRRDQHKKIKGIVDTNSKFPIVALGLVRDLVKNTSMREVVSAVGFSDSEHRAIPHDSHTGIKFITVYTKGFNSPNCDQIGTAYHFNLVPDQKFTAPTL